MKALKNEIQYNTERARDERVHPQFLATTANPKLLGVGSAFPEQEYSQAQIEELFEISHPVVQKFLRASHIAKRHLYLPIDSDTQKLRPETQEDLIEKFHFGVRDIGVKAALAALSSAGLRARDIDLIVAVTSSGFAVPGLSSIISRELGMSDDIHRLDVVGMGCNAGMSALYSASQMLKGQNNRVGLVVCCEINSAIYTKDETIRTGIVNSLFGDGAAALVVQSGGEPFGQSPSTLNPSPKYKSPFQPRPQANLQLLDFESLTLSEQSEAMRFDWNFEQKRWSFYLSKDIPFVIGKHMKTPVHKLLQRHGLESEEVTHWVLHTGGEAVIRGAQKSLGLSDEQVRHTRSVLRDYGNISSGSFMVSLERLLAEGEVEKGDLIVLIAMGPGSTIEACLAKAF